MDAQKTQECHREDAKDTKAFRRVRIELPALGYREIH
jgi:hypothetical protein